MNLASSFVWVLALVAVADAASRQQQQQSNRNNEESLTESINLDTMNRIKQRYLRAAAAEQVSMQTQKQRFMMSDGDRIGQPSRSKDKRGIMSPNEVGEPLSMSMDMSMSMP